MGEKIPQKVTKEFSKAVSKVAPMNLCYFPRRVLVRSKAPEKIGTKSTVRNRLNLLEKVDLNT